MLLCSSVRRGASKATAPTPSTTRHYDAPAHCVNRGSYRGRLLYSGKCNDFRKYYHRWETRNRDKAAKYLWSQFAALGVNLPRNYYYSSVSQALVLPWYYCSYVINTACFAPPLSFLSPIPASCWWRTSWRSSRPWRRPVLGTRDSRVWNLDVTVARKQPSKVKNEPICRTIERLYSTRGAIDLRVCRLANNFWEGRVRACCIHRGAHW